MNTPATEASPKMIEPKSDASAPLAPNRLIANKISNAHQLFQPYRLKSLVLKNRIVMAPMTRSFSPGGVPGSNVADYYARRAEGEV